ncbi:hypothetical protein [Bartonella raoultii]|uniref:Uncharacterized protein n=1 Tax=Bartonella raoultii TaxID=1457020 RepID=A0ABS7I546_9HYPH|nr:hypothetical protein [Bartonella raoultii]MBX4335156.1 hypothetical protein [Bartonella raoultii]
MSEAINSWFENEVSVGFIIIFVILITVIIVTLIFWCNRQCERAEKERRYKENLNYKEENEPWKLYETIQELNEANMAIEKKQCPRVFVQTQNDNSSMSYSMREKELKVVSFKEDMMLSSRDYKIIFCIFIINLAVGGVIRMLGEANREFDIITLVSMLIVFISIGVSLASPVIWVLHIRLTKKLKVMIQQLEEAIEQRDKAIMTHDLREKKR